MNDINTLRWEAERRRKERRLEELGLYLDAPVVAAPVPGWWWLIIVVGLAILMAMPQ